VNVGSARSSAHTDIGVTGIDKRAVTEPVEVRAPGPRGTGGSGLSGDSVCDLRYHGGDEQAVYAYAREDLDFWQAELGRPLAGGVFGENLTTLGLDLTHALIGERWQVGERVVLEVSCPRVPCRTFAGWLERTGWVKAFTRHAAPGAYLRVLVPGAIRTGDPVRVAHRPDHGVSIQNTFQAISGKPELLPRLVALPGLSVHWEQLARKRTGHLADQA
jgi:MOSC domain-containing protein YiiM